VGGTIIASGGTSYSTGAPAGTIDAGGSSSGRSAGTGGTTVTGGVSSMASYAGAGGVAGMGGLTGTGGVGGRTNVAGATSIGACVATGGTTVVPFATIPGASVLVSPSARVAVTYTSASSNPGSYSPPSVPVGAECRPGISTYTLDLVSQRLWWDDCSVVGDPQSAGSYFREVGSTCLSSSEFESARAALSLVTVTGKGQCWEYIGSFPATIKMTMTSPAGSQMYGDEKSCGVAVGPAGLSDFEQILASLANAASSAGVSSGSCGTAGAGGSAGTAGGPSMANAILLFGGSGESSILGDTWQWDGSRWTLLKPAHSPRARSDASVATFGGQVVLFGGYDGTPAVGNGPRGFLGDTWTWNGTDWTQPCSAISPRSRMDGATATLNGALFLFGGSGEQPSGRIDAPGDFYAVMFGDTWVWDGSSWTEGYTPRSPPINLGVMATLAGRVVLFGGEVADGTAAAIDETWTWDGAVWTKAKPAQSPPARYSAAASTLGGTIVLFGGYNGSGTILGDTWTWDGATWTQQHPLKSPSPRTGAAMATLGDRVVLFGGEDRSGGWLGDTWAWNGTDWTQVATSGPSPRSNAAMSGP
jgi:hypothetical protein